MNLSLQIIFTCLLITISIASTACIDESEFNAAISNVIEVASEEELNSHGIEELVKDLQQAGTRLSNNSICFNEQDFASFGYLVSSIFENDMNIASTSTDRMTKDDKWTPNFDKGERDHTLVSRNRRTNCMCDKCAAKHQSYCIRGNKMNPICCPHYCANIFSAMSVGALSGLSNDGLEPCCINAAKECLKEERITPRTATGPISPKQKNVKEERSSKKSGSKPSFDFRGQSASQQNVSHSDNGEDANEHFSVTSSSESAKNNSDVGIPFLPDITSNDNSMNENEIVENEIETSAESEIPSDFA